MNLAEYDTLILGWRQKYGVPPPKPESSNLAEIRVSCKRCGKVRSKMHRHHKRNDLFFAKLLPDSYAARYCEFNKDDVDRLCNKCHENIHKYWRPLYDRMLGDLMLLEVVDEAWCEYYRAVFLEWYETWLATSYRRRR